MDVKEEVKNSSATQKSQHKGSDSLDGKIRPAKKLAHTLSISFQPSTSNKVQIKNQEGHSNAKSPKLAQKDKTLDAPVKPDVHREQSVLRKQDTKSSSSTAHTQEFHDDKEIPSDKIMAKIPISMKNMGNAFPDIPHTAAAKHTAQKVSAENKLPPQSPGNLLEIKNFPPNTKQLGLRGNSPQVVLPNRSPQLLQPFKNHHSISSSFTAHANLSSTNQLKLYISDMASNSIKLHPQPNLPLPIEGGYNPQNSEDNVSEGHLIRNKTVHRHSPFSWSVFHECSVTCGAGVKKRYRKCSATECQVDGVETEILPCYKSYCPRK